MLRSMSLANSGVITSHSTAATYAPAIRKAGIPRYDFEPFAFAMSAISNAMAMAPR